MNKNISLTRKEREKLNRRKEILEAALNLFASKGFMNTTLDEIAEASEFGKGTLYNYFKNKEEIINSIIEDVLNQNLSSIKEADSSVKEFVGFINLYTSLIFDYCLKNRNAFILLAEYYIQKMKRDTHEKKKDTFMKIHEQIDNILIKRIEEAIRSKEIKNLNALQLHMLYHNMVFPYALDLIHHDYLNSLSMDNHVTFINNIMFNGISKR
jgi:AcrR family transcriptional regulator